MDQQTLALARTARDWMTALVAADRRDLSARQMSVLLTVYTETEAQTVRGLAARLSVSKPAITRVLDRLGDLDLTARKTDPTDRRSVLVRRTTAGAAYVRWAAQHLRDAMDEEGRRAAIAAIEANATHARQSAEAAAL
jgi:DNA-binding MarR family transcriptional regulator